MSTSSLEAGDVEKALPGESRTNSGPHGLPDGPNDRRTHSPAAPAANRIGRGLQMFEKQLIKFNIEARGIQRVESHERHGLNWRSYVSMFCLWFSVNLAPVNITLGMLASQLFGLSFKDAALCAVFGALTGSMAVGYIATFGPVSGHRSMVHFIRDSRCRSELNVLLGFRKIYYGLVASQARGAIEHHCPSGLLYDRLRSCRPDIIGRIQQW